MLCRRGVSVCLDHGVGSEQKETEVSMIHGKHQRTFHHSFISFCHCEQCPAPWALAFTALIQLESAAGLEISADWLVLSVAGVWWVQVSKPTR